MLFLDVSLAKISEADVYILWHVVSSGLILGNGELKMSWKRKTESHGTQDTQVSHCVGSNIMRQHQAISFFKIENKYGDDIRLFEMEFFWPQILYAKLTR